MTSWWMPFLVFALIGAAGGAIGFLAERLSTPSEPRKPVERATPRTAAFPAGPPTPGVCPICGMDDPDRLDARWRTWAAHADCLDWLMPGGPSFVDEYANPALGGSGRRRRKPHNYPTTGGHMSSDATVYDLRPFPEWLMEQKAVEVTSLDDPDPVYVPGGFVMKPEPPPGPGSATTARDS